MYGLVTTNERFLTWSAGKESSNSNALIRVKTRAFILRDEGWMSSDGDERGASSMDLLKESKAITDTATRSTEEREHVAPYTGDLFCSFRNIEPSVRTVVHKSTSVREKRKG